MTQDIFIKLFRLLEDTCHQFDLQLTYMFTRQEESTSSSSLKTLVVAKAKMAEAQESSAVLEAAVTYMLWLNMGRTAQSQICVSNRPGHEKICGNDGKK